MLLGVGWEVWLGLVAHRVHRGGVLGSGLIGSSIGITLQSGEGGDILGVILVLLLALLEAANSVVADLSISRPEVIQLLRYVTFKEKLQSASKFRVKFGGYKIVCSPVYPGTICAAYF